MLPLRHGCRHRPCRLIHTHEGDIVLPSGMDKMGEISGRLRKTLTGIQDGKIEAT